MTPSTIICATWMPCGWYSRARLCASALNANFPQAAFSKAPQWYTDKKKTILKIWEKWGSLEGRDTRERKKTTPNPENPAPPHMEAVALVKSRVPFCHSTMSCMTCWTQRKAPTQGIVIEHSNDSALICVNFGGTQGNGIFALYTCIAKTLQRSISHWQLSPCCPPPPAKKKTGTLEM